MFLNVPGQPIVCFTFFITYCSSFVIAEMEDILNMRINRFHHLNISGQLIPLDDSIKTEMYVTCISMIGVDFQFAHSMTDNLMTYLLLNIDHWRPNYLSQLTSSGSIRDHHQNIKEKILKAWSEINENGLPKLDKLVKILVQMTKLRSQMVSEEIEVLPVRNGLFNEEEKWVADSVQTVCTNLFSWPQEKESWMIAEEKAIACGDMTNFHTYYGYCIGALQEKSQFLLSIYGEGSTPLKLDFGNFQMLSMLLQARIAMCSSIMDKLQMTMNKPIIDHDQTLVRTPTIHVGKILQIQGIFTEQQSVFFSNILKEVHPYFTDKNIFALLFLSIVLNNDASRGLQKTCQYFIQRLLGQKYKRQNAEEMLGFIKTKIIFLTNYLSETTKGFSS